MPRMRTAAIMAPLVAAGAVGAGLVWFSRRWIVPPRVIFNPPAGDMVETVQFRSEDGIDLAGWLLRGRTDAPALILCHGYQRSMEEPFGLGVELRQRGFNVLLFDFRGCGRSGGRYTTIGAREPDDLLAAVRWVRERFSSTARIGVHGISMGGAVAVTAASRTPDIAAVVADSAFAHLSGAVELRFSALAGLNLWVHRVTMRVAEALSGGRVAQVRPVDAIAAIGPRPVLLIHGDRDGIVPHAHIGELFEAAAEPKSAWTVTNSTHAMARMDVPEEYVERVASFFTDALVARPLAATG